MKFVKPLLAASVIAVASTSAIAGGLDNAQTVPVIIPPVEDTGSMGSIGSLGGAAPAIIAAVVIAAAAASGGS